MLSILILARLDPRMVEVPLELTTELARGFEGSAMLASSGLPRKIRLKPQKDQIKLSTAYQIDQLVADIVRGAMGASPEDLERVQGATRAFVRAVREKRQDAASLRIESNGRGRIGIVESIPQGASRVRSQPPPESTPPMPLERRIEDLEGRVARLLPAAEAGARLEERIARAEKRIGELEARPARAAAAHGESQRGTLRRATAVDAFADGLRRELLERVSTQLEEITAAVSRLDQAASLAQEAEILGADVAASVDELRSASTQATAREESLQGLQEEVELYSGADLAIADRLVARLVDVPAPLDPAPVLEKLAEALAGGPAEGEDLRDWFSRSAALCGWTLIDPRPAEPFKADLHEASQSGEAVQETSMPGIRRADGSVLFRARVSAGPRHSDASPRDSAPRATEAAACEADEVA